jgi:hypothetical protein
MLEALGLIAMGEQMLGERKTIRSLQIVVLVAAILFGLTTRPAVARDDWTVVRVSGAAFARTHENGQFAIRAGMVLPSSASVGTGASGRAMLQRGSGSLVVSPGTVVQLWDPRPGETTVIQHKGRIDVEVEKRNAPYFNVETTMLSAIVKGTGFTVTTSARASAVRVAHGVVNVTERATGRTVDLGAGQSAATRGSRGLGVSGPGALPSVSMTTPPAPSAVLSASLPGLSNRSAAAGSNGIGNGGRGNRDGSNAMAGGNGNGNGGNGNGNAGG